jgi:hypothetical protein
MKGVIGQEILPSAPRFPQLTNILMILLRTPGQPYFGKKLRVSRWNGEG